MKQREKLQAGLAQLSDTFVRFPLTILLLVLIALVNGIEIQNHLEQYPKLLFSLIIGVFLSLVSQVIYERFFDKLVARRMLMSGAIILTGVYSLILLWRNDLNTAFSIRNSVIWFILFIAFLWIPTIKRSYSFNESFLAVFKAFFLALFYSGVLFVGVSLIIMAIDMLIVSVDSNTIPHAANLIFGIFATIHLLSALPDFQNGKKREGGETSERPITVSISKFLETLISYVIIPITAVFTLVLLLYVIINITGSFWTDNLLEPLLVSYSITVILVYLLASNITNHFAINFRRIFPKVLVPIVLFQTIASILKIGEMGVTHGRYYAILFGVFATIAGIIFSIVPIRKNGLIAPILIILAFVSIIPPIDAFTVSRNNQIGRLETSLNRNNMLQDGKISPNATISDQDRDIIISSVQYLNRMGYTDDVAWLSSYAENRNFENTFGFPQFDNPRKDNTIYLHREAKPIPITGYDIMLHTNLYFSAEEREIGTFEKEGMSFRLMDQIHSDGKRSIVLLDEVNKEILNFDIQEILDRGILLQGTELMTLEDASFTKENDFARLTLVAENIHIGDYSSDSTQGKRMDMDTYILVTLK